VAARERLLDQQPRHHIQGFLPLGALDLALDAEAAKLGLRAGLARTELDRPPEIRSSVAMRSATRAGWL
jgi:hypothetical protein